MLLMFLKLTVLAKDVKYLSNEEVKVVNSRSRKSLVLVVYQNHPLLLRMIKLLLPSAVVIWLKK